jgi:hydroxyisourate hydrolase
VPDLYSHFTKRAKKVLQLATEEAAEFGHNYIGTEHLLLGLIAEQEGIAARVLEDSGLKLLPARNAVQCIVGTGESTTAHRELIEPAQKTIKYAIEEAQRLGHQYVGTEHLLLGLLRVSEDGEGMVAGVFDIVQVPLNGVKSQVLRVLRHGAGGSSAEESPPAQKQPGPAIIHPATSTPRLSTHVLDTVQGRPAAGVQIELWALGANGERTLLKTVQTNNDGRTDEPLLTGEHLKAGSYELRFAVGDYFARQTVQRSEPPFLNIVPVQFTIADASAHYHVPLLVSPWAYSTYRGS